MSSILLIFLTWTQSKLQLLEYLSLEKMNLRDGHFDFCYLPLNVLINLRQKGKFATLLINCESISVIWWFLALVHVKLHGFWMHGTLFYKFLVYKFCFLHTHPFSFNLLAHFPVTKHWVYMYSKKMRIFMETWKK